MKFNGQLIVNKPQAEVASLFVDPQYLGEYQDGFVSKTLLEGTEGAVGAKSKMLYKYGKRDMELTETILANDLPNSFQGQYHHIHMDNTMECRFIPVDENSTRFEFDFEYTRINWFMPKLIAILFPSMYKKQGLKWMKQFKEFVESRS